MARVRLGGRFVTLEPLKPEDVAELWPWAQDGEVWAHMLRAVRTQADLAAWADERMAAERAGIALAFCQRDALSGGAIGSTSLFDYDEAARRVEIGHTWLGRPYRGTNVNPESKFLLLRHAFEVLGLQRVQFKTDARNLRSQRAIEKLGAVREGVLRSWTVRPDGSPRDTVIFSVVDHEWPAVRERLARRLNEQVEGPDAKVAGQGHG
jgi:N-acetyltransferase